MSVKPTGDDVLDNWEEIDEVGVSIPSIEKIVNVCTEYFVPDHTYFPHTPKKSVNVSYLTEHLFFIILFFFYSI